MFKNINMKIKKEGLDRTHVYYLRGITQEQAEELLKWLIDNDSLTWEIDDFRTYDFLFFEEHSKWDASRNLTPTTHISTLFEEQSYEEQLVEALELVETLKRKINETKIGDWMFLKDCGFRQVKKPSHVASLAGSGWQKVTDPFTLETLNKYGAN